MLAMNWSEFFYMGGYAFYVWGSYLVALVVIGAEVLAVVRRNRRLVARGDAGSKSSKSESQ
jgi:heme exporter protein D